MLGSSLLLRWIPHVNVGNGAQVVEDLDWSLEGLDPTLCGFPVLKDWWKWDFERPGHNF